MKIQTLTENLFLILENQTIKLGDLYDEDELNNPYEIISQFVYDEDLEHEFEVHEMSPEQAKTLLTHAGDITVFKAYKDFATSEQKELIKYKTTHYDQNRIIVLFDNKVIDGNHHVIAAILAKKPLKYINLDY